MHIQSKRNFLGKFATSLVGLGIVGRSDAATAAKSDQLLTNWVHGHSCDIGNPDLIESVTSTGGAKVLRGRSFSQNCLHYTISVPAAQARVNAILLRFRTHQGANICALRIFDGEQEVATLDGLNFREERWAERRIVLPALATIKRGLGVTVGINFDAVDRQFDIGAVGAEFTV